MNNAVSNVGINLKLNNPFYRENNSLFEEKKNIYIYIQDSCSSWSSKENCC